MSQFTARCFVRFHIIWFDRASVTQQNKSCSLNGSDERWRVTCIAGPSSLTELFCKDNSRTFWPSLTPNWGVRRSITVALVSTPRLWLWTFTSWLICRTKRVGWWGSDDLNKPSELVQMVQAWTIINSLNQKPGLFAEISLFVWDKWTERVVWPTKAALMRISLWQRPRRLCNVRRVTTFCRRQIWFWFWFGPLRYSLSLKEMVGWQKRCFSWITVAFVKVMGRFSSAWWSSWNRKSKSGSSGPPWTIYLCHANPLQLLLHAILWSSSVQHVHLSLVSESFKPLAESNRICLKFCIREHLDFFRLQQNVSQLQLMVISVPQMLIKFSFRQKTRESHQTQDSWIILHKLSEEFSVFLDVVQNFFFFFGS